VGPAPHYTAAMSKPTLLYFPARGRAEIIRLLLAEAGVDYQEHPVGKGTPPQGGRPTDLAALLADGTLPFGAVPVWEEPGGFRLAQSHAIAAHLARTHGLAGKSPAGKKTHAEVEVGACAACHLSHDGRWPQIAGSRGHRIHVESQKIACVRCHAAGVHGFEPVTESCRACHGPELTTLGTVEVRFDGQAAEQRAGQAAGRENSFPPAVHLT